MEAWATYPDGSNDAAQPGTSAYSDAALTSSLPTTSSCPMLPSCCPPALRGASTSASREGAADSRKRPREGVLDDAHRGLGGQPPLAPPPLRAAAGGSLTRQPSSLSSPVLSGCGLSGGVGYLTPQPSPSLSRAVQVPLSFVAAAGVELVPAADAMAAMALANEARRQQRQQQQQLLLQQQQQQQQLLLLQQQEQQQQQRRKRERSSSSNSHDLAEPLLPLAHAPLSAYLHPHALHDPSQLAAVPLAPPMFAQPAYLAGSLLAPQHVLLLQQQQQQLQQQQLLQFQQQMALMRMQRRRTEAAAADTEATMAAPTVSAQSEAAGARRSGGGARCVVSLEAAAWHDQAMAGVTAPGPAVAPTPWPETGTGESGESC